MFEALLSYLSGNFRAKTHKFNVFMRNQDTRSFLYTLKNSF